MTMMITYQLSSRILDREIYYFHLQLLMSQLVWPLEASRKCMMTFLEGKKTKYFNNQSYQNVKKKKKKKKWKKKKEKKKERYILAKFLMF